VCATGQSLFSDASGAGTEVGGGAEGAGSESGRISVMLLYFHAYFSAHTSTFTAVKCPPTFPPLGRHVDPPLFLPSVLQKHLMQAWVAVAD